MTLLTLLKEVCVIAIMLSGIVLAFWVYLAKPESKTNRIFLLLTLFSILWILFSFIGGVSKNIDLAIMMKRLNFASLLPFFVTAFIFSTLFPKEFKRNKYVELVLIVIGIIGFYISAFTPLVVASVASESWGNNVVGGKAYDIFNITIFAFTIIILANLVRKYFLLDRSNRTKVVYMLIGTMLYGLLNIVFNVIFPLIDGSYRFDFFGDFSIIFFLAFTAYAIVKHQLFNIKVVATELTVIILSITLFVEIFISSSINESVMKGFIWILATYGGYVLIKSVKVEIKQKEDLQKLSKQLEKANAHLEELDATKDNFLSMAAHELNTPISAIEGYLSMIVDEHMCGPLNESANKYLANVYSSSKRLAALVRDLLNVSRIESNRVHLIYEEVQMEDVLDKAIAEVKIKADQAKHELIWNRPTELTPKTFLDVSRITEVIINLLGNAVKYTEAGGKIEVGCHADSGKIVVSVKDNGRGIPKDKSEHIFEKFVQVDVLKDEVKGTGLGMFISKNLVAMHKGKLWFTSSIKPEDHGTTFYFSLPVLSTKPADNFDGQGAILQLK